MAKWIIPEQTEDLRYPDQILQEYADALALETQNKLSGQVTEQISYDSSNRPKIYYALHVYVTKLKQSYRLFEVEQKEDKPYPVNLRAFFYTGSELFENLKTSELLNSKLQELVSDKMIGNLLAHFMRLSDLKEE